MKLDLKYRPRQFSEVVGQKASSLVLQAMLNKNMLEPVLLFTGPSGTGKTSMARIIAAELNPDSKEFVHSGQHPNVIEIDAASNGSVAALRDLKKDLNYATAGHVVVILDEVHAISKEGMTVLLNLLEFPPTNVTIILLTNQFNLIPKEVRHRCDTYHFNKASIADLTERLVDVVEKEGAQIDAELINFIAQRSEGSYRESLMILSQMIAGEIRTVEQYQNLHGMLDYGPKILAEALKGPEFALKVLEDSLYYAADRDIFEQISNCLIDITLLKGNINSDHVGKSLEVRQVLADNISKSDLMKITRILWDLQVKLSSGNLTLNLKLAVNLISDIICIKEEPVVRSNKMSFEQMQAYQS
jgi:DNA polymerase III subunit gamma/tau